MVMAFLFTLKKNKQIKPLRTEKAADYSVNSLYKNRIQRGIFVKDKANKNITRVKVADTKGISDVTLIVLLRFTVVEPVQ